MEKIYEGLAHKSNASENELRASSAPQPTDEYDSKTREKEIPSPPKIKRIYFRNGKRLDGRSKAQLTQLQRTGLLLPSVRTYACLPCQLDFLILRKDSLLT